MLQHTKRKWRDINSLVWRKQEGADDDGGISSFPSKLKGADFQIAEKMAGGKEPHWNPVLFSTNDQKVFLFYKKGRKIAHWRTYIRISQDGGRTFGKERELVTGDIGGRGLYETNQFSFKMGAFYVRHLLREKNGKDL